MSPARFSPFFLTLLSLGCNENKVNEIEEVDPISRHLQVDPAVLHFGEVAYYDSAVAEVTLTNIGDAGLYVDEVALSSAGFALDAPWERTLLEPDVPIQVAVRYTPTGAEDEGSLVVRSEDADEAFAVPLLGGGLYPLLQILPGEVDFGEVAVCNTDEREVILLNRGDADLVVSAMALVGSKMEVVTAPATPLTLAPSETAALTVRFSPTALADSAGTLWVESNDLSGTDTAALTGQGVSLAISEYVDTFRQPMRPWDKADVLFYLDQSASMDANAERLVSGFSSMARFFQQEDIDWQVMVVTDDDGCNNGGIIPSNDPYASTRFADALHGPSGLLAESGLTLAHLALGQTGEGQCNEGFLREEAKPLAVMVSDESEQSQAPWLDLTTAITSLAPELSVVSITGDYPDGCASAAPGLGYYHAAMETYGLALSICEEDWTDGFEAAAALADDPTDTFALRYVPDLDTLVVEIDGNIATNWTYLEAENAVRFTPMPAGGSLITASYSLSIDCEG